MRKSKKTSRNTKGFVLFTVLGILTIISLLVVAIRVNTASVTKETIYLLERQKRLPLIQSGFEIAAAKILSRDVGGEEPEPSGSLTGTFSASYPDGSINGSYENEAGRVNLNEAHEDLLQALFTYAGLDEDDSKKMAYRIIDWHDDNDNRDQKPGGSESNDYTDNRNSEPPDYSFESILEIAQIPGMNQALSDKIAPYATVLSGQAELHVDLAKPELLIHLPDISTETKKSLQKLIDGNSTDGKIDIIGGITTNTESVAWRVNFEITLSNGINQNIEGVIKIKDSGSSPYQLLKYTGPLEKID